MKPENEGAVKNAIIIFGKMPILWGEKKDHFGGQIYIAETYVMQYRYLLRIDLWIVILDFDWKSKIKEL